MTEWLYRLPVSLMGLVIFAMTYLGAAAIHGIVQTLATGERERAFKAISTGPNTGVAVSILLIAAHNRPFVGELSVRPDVLLQVLPPGLP
jgi:hypothetical protein